MEADHGTTYVPDFVNLCTFRRRINADHYSVYFYHHRTEDQK